MKSVSLLLVVAWSPVRLSAPHVPSNERTHSVPIQLPACLASFRDLKAAEPRQHECRFLRPPETFTDIPARRKSVFVARDAEDTAKILISVLHWRRLYRPGKHRKADQREQREAPPWPILVITKDYMRTNLTGFLQLPEDTVAEEDEREVTEGEESVTEKAEGGESDRGPVWVNSLNNNEVITTKNGLHSTLKASSLLHLQPPTFDLSIPEEADAFFNNEAPLGEGLWMTKLPDESGGRGVRIGEDLEEIRERAQGMTAKGGTLLAQRYIDSPLLVDGRKVDQRFFWAIASLDSPFLVVMFSRWSLVRLAPERFTLEAATLKDGSVHVTNNQSGNKHSGVKNGSLELDITLLELAEHLESSGAIPSAPVFFDETIESAREIIRQVSTAARPRLLESRFNTTRQAPQGWDGLFELMGLDALLDSSFRLCLLSAAMKTTSFLLMVAWSPVRLSAPHVPSNERTHSVPIQLPACLASFRDLKAAEPRQHECRFLRPPETFTDIPARRKSVFVARDAEDTAKILISVLHWRRWPHPSAGRHRKARRRKGREETNAFSGDIPPWPSLVITKDYVNTNLTEFLQLPENTTERKDQQGSTEGEEGVTGKREGGQPDRGPVWVNSLNNNEVITTKNGLHSTLKASSLLHLQPPTFDLSIPEEADAFFNNEAPLGDGLWMTKLPDESGGRGVRIGEDLEEIRERAQGMTAKGETLLAQRYIDSPLLVDGRKVDQRFFWAIASLDSPFLVVMFSRWSLVRLAPEKFTLESGALKEDYVHVTNTESSKAHPRVKNGSLELDITLLELAERLESSGAIPSAPVFFEETIESAREIIRQVSTAARPRLLESRFNTTRQAPEGWDGLFELMGLDALLDSSFRLWLVEVQAGIMIRNHGQYESIFRDLFWLLWNLHNGARCADVLRAVSRLDGRMNVVVCDDASLVK
uniref:Tubulin--tyrosine ligase-like protein 5 n=1 Tax=Chromera velia CCMP2878 TaxID=1169474 RepID=A0A0G4G3I6_9ALVE|eukprot:Cvel_20061.t1-p1 / transcript=Cvel_20061.t1 / gene=Cvel_20061 / organism=Chromera_velia_CCMP2878 / gene_product=Tubulin glycylase 3D, putative / transcript_product=Tubulin glycylase 3D, putative / location=Cvel_scaffold1774:7363-13739(-) / protein_length=931 / sequence_SO=supercontig / SO=protein_coding / is_pseudo=false